MAVFLYQNHIYSSSSPWQQLRKTGRRLPTVTTQGSRNCWWWWWNGPLEVKKKKKKKTTTTTTRRNATCRPQPPSFFIWSTTTAEEDNSNIVNYTAIFPSRRKRRFSSEWRRAAGTTNNLVPRLLQSTTKTSSPLLPAADHVVEEEEEEEEDDAVVLRRRVMKAKVLFLVAAVMCLCNADRVVMSVGVVPLASTHAWSTSFLGVVQSSFLWGYLGSSVVGGALADRYGGKRVMARGVALWSLATLLTPWAAHHSTWMLLAVRALFGVAQGVAIPCMNIILTRWFPSNERASAVGVCMGGFHLGNVIGFLASPLIMSGLGISGAFALYAACGFFLLSLWTALGITDDNHLPIIEEVASRSSIISTTIAPSSPTAAYDDVDADADATHSSLPPLPSPKQLLSKLPSWAIIFANFTRGYFVLLSWMPVYFKTVFNVNLKEAAWFSAIPWGLMAISGYVAGISSDYLIKLGYNITLVRKIMQSIGFIGPGMALLCLNHRARTPSLAVAFLTVALSLSSFSQAAFLLNVQDIAPRSAGLLHGISNSFGTLAAIISTVGTGYFVQWQGSFQAFLTLTSILYFVAALFWNLHATADQVFP